MQFGLIFFTVIIPQSNPLISTHPGTNPIPHWAIDTENEEQKIVQRLLPAPRGLVMSCHATLNSNSMLQ